MSADGYQKLLMKDEEVLLTVKPAFWTVSKILWLIAAALFSLTTLGVPLVLALGWLSEARWNWKHTDYVLTNRRVLVSRRKLGSFNLGTSRNLAHCLHDKIQNIDLSTRVTLLGARGTIAFDTAGTTLKELVWNNLKNPEDVYRQASEILHK
jgi:hypothetical protein